jgi:hypothetical protein
MVPEVLVFSPLNQLKRLVAREFLFRITNSINMVVVATSYVGVTLTLFNVGSLNYV